MGLGTQKNDKDPLMLRFIRSLRIKLKIIAGFAMVLAILITISAIAVVNFSTTETQVESYSERVRVATIARELERDALDLRRFAREFALTGQEADAKRTED